MSIAIKAYYENGEVKLTEPAPTGENVPVTVIFPEPEKSLKKNAIRFGSLAGKFRGQDSGALRLRALSDPSRAHSGNFIGNLGTSSGGIGREEKKFRRGLGGLRRAKPRP